MHSWTKILLSIFFIFSACSSPIIDEKYAAQKVKKELSLTDDVHASQIKNGSNALIYLVANSKKKYVIKFIKDRVWADHEIFNAKIASQGEYGPKIYFANNSQKVLIMEYLAGPKITAKDVQNDHIYLLLAQFLQKMHQGENFGNFGFDIFKRILRGVEKNRAKYPKLDFFEKTASKIKNALLPYKTLAPCHNDLHLTNLMFFPNECKAIDFATGSMGNPFFDLATALENFPQNPIYENVLLTTYFGRELTSKEKAKLFLTRQLVLMKWELEQLSKISEEDLKNLKDIQAPSYDTLHWQYFEGQLDPNLKETQLKMFKSRWQLIEKNAQSLEFMHAIDTLHA